MLALVPIPPTNHPKFIKVGILYCNVIIQPLVKHSSRLIYHRDGRKTLEMSVAKNLVLFLMNILILQSKVCCLFNLNKLNSAFALPKN